MDCQCVEGSELRKDFWEERKVNFFVATVEAVLLYGCEAWTKMKQLEKCLDGCSTRVLRVVHWSQHLTNQKLYGYLPWLSRKIWARRLHFASATDTTNWQSADWCCENLPI